MIAMLRNWLAEEMICLALRLFTRRDWAWKLLAVAFSDYLEARILQRNEEETK
jgi:hypothetical protein